MREMKFEELTKTTLECTRKNLSCQIFFCKRMPQKMSDTHKNEKFFFKENVFSFILRNLWGHKV